MERLLKGFLFEPDELLRGRAIEALGALAAAKGVANMEMVRIQLRRIIWAMSDESGNSFWHAPELMGETLAQVPALIREFCHLLPLYAAEPQFERGAHWAMARIAAVDPVAFEGATETLARSLQAPDPYIRGLASCALSLRGLENTAAILIVLRQDAEILEYYDWGAGAMRCLPVGSLVDEALRRAGISP